MREKRAVADRVVEPCSDDACQFHGVAEVHGMGCSVDQGDRQVLRSEPGDFADAFGRRQEGVAPPRTARVGTGVWSRRSSDGKRVSSPKRRSPFSGPELHVVRESDGEHPGSHGRRPSPAARRHDPWAGCARLQQARPDEPVHPLRRSVSDLQADRAAHRVADQDDLVDLEAVEDRDGALGKTRDVEHTISPLTAPVPGEVWNHVDPTSGKGSGRRHQVGAGDREAVQVDEGDAVPARGPSEVDRRPVHLEPFVHPAVAWSPVGLHGPRLVFRARPPPRSAQQHRDFLGTRR